jgi:excisionase family DNA binding protein
MTQYKSWTMQEFADFLRCSVRTLRRKVAQGLVPEPHLIGNMKRFDHQEVMAWWESLSVK